MLAAILNIHLREIFVRRHMLFWFRMVLWLGPMAALYAWIGSSALPSAAVGSENGALCSAASAAARAAPPGPGLLRKVRANPGDPIQTVPGMPPVLDAGNLYSGTAPDRLSPAVGGA